MNVTSVSDVSVEDLVSVSFVFCAESTLARRKAYFKLHLKVEE